MVKVISHRTIYRDERSHCAFPSLVRLSDGNILIAFRKARDSLWLVPENKIKDIDPLGQLDHVDSRSHIMLLELGPDGTIIAGSPDHLPFDPEAADQDPSLLLLPGERIFLASFSWYPLPSQTTELLRPGAVHPGCRFMFWGSHTSIRTREPGAWLSHHHYILPHGGYGRKLGRSRNKGLVGPVRGQPLYRQGVIYLPLYDDKKEGCALFSSNDGGESWEFRAIIARDPEQVITYQEPALCEDGRGGIVCFMRTAGAEGRLATARMDSDFQWSEPKLHEVTGHPFHPLRLNDGRVLLCYGYREKPYGIRARLLDDTLQDPDNADEIIIRDDGVCPDIGYPWAVQLSDDSVLVAYYWTDETGIRHIAGSRLELNDLE